MNQAQQLTEFNRCFESPVYFIGQHIKIYDAVLGEWIPFTLWPKQAECTSIIDDNFLIIALKARQLGLTWLVLAYALWMMKFRPAATVLLFSRRDTEAVHLLDDRLKGLYKHLPEWLKVGDEIAEDSAHEWQLGNGSVARAFPTSAGDSYTATLAIVDEADLVPDLNRLMRAVKPTVDGGGKMILLSRSDKRKPASTFKAIYRASRRNENDWAAVFLPRNARPDRDAEWYEAQKRDILARTGGLDDLHEQYPATDVEALEPSTLDKRLPAAWLKQCYEERQPVLSDDIRENGINVAQLAVYEYPQGGAQYLIGADPAEGNPTSDDSALVVVDVVRGKEVAALADKLPPSLFAAVIAHVSRYYNNAPVMVERNNHGHAVLLWLSDNARDVPMLSGLDGRPGWLTSSLSKVYMWDAVAEILRYTEAGIRAFETYLQLSSIDAKSLSAPQGELDDLAVAFALAQCARVVPRVETRVSYDPYVISQW